MKKIIFSTLLFAFLAFSITPVLAFTGSENKSEPVETLSKSEVKELSKDEAKVRIEILTNRLLEIKAMDLKELPRSERRTFKKEVRDIEKELKWQQNNTGIYISGSALLIIILLIILL